jgi:hypothetical protein
MQNKSKTDAAALVSSRSIDVGDHVPVDNNWRQQLEATTVLVNVKGYATASYSSENRGWVMVLIFPYCSHDCSGLSRPGSGSVIG